MPWHQNRKEYQLKSGGRWNRLYQIIYEAQSHLIVLDPIERNRGCRWPINNIWGKEMPQSKFELYKMKKSQPGILAPNPMKTARKGVRV